MLASVALVGCTNEDPIDVGNEKQEVATRGNAYISVGFTGNTNSSRAADGYTGDGDGSREDSEHYNAGTAAENEVKEVLLIIAKSTDNEEVTSQDITKNSYANLTAVPTDGTVNGVVALLSAQGEKAAIKKVNDSSKSYEMTAPYRMDYLGAYKVLVVVNPVDALKAAVKDKNSKEAYIAVCDFVGQARTGENADGNFMMTNQLQKVVVATEAHNTPESAVSAKIPVERVISKVTYRFKEGNSTYPGSVAGLPNVHPVTVKVTSATPTPVAYWYSEAVTANGGYTKYWYDNKFYEAQTANGTIYWVLFKELGEDASYFDEQGKLVAENVEAIFTNSFSKESYTGVVTDNTQGTAEVKKTAKLFTEDIATAKGNVDESLVSTLKIVQTQSASQDETYYVQLTHYALTNLSNEVYAVRHIMNGTNVRQFGYLGDSEYLVDPKTASKNTTNDTTRPEQYSTYFKTGTALKTIIDNIHAANYKTSELGDLGFFTLPTELEANAVTDVTGGNHNSGIGAHMQYVYENAVTAERQVAGLVTGIVFAGKVYDGAGNEVPVMYKYNGKFYRNLRALLNENAIEGLTENSTDNEATAKGIDVYTDGCCYYYSTQIKHFEDSFSKELGVMEYAIMRNNVYSLAVTHISDMGDAKLNLEPQNPVIDVRAYITLEVEILPWIVRFNDLEL